AGGPEPVAGAGSSAAPPLLALHETAPELFRVALHRATADRWRAQAGSPSAVAVPVGEGESRTSADGTALFLLPPGAPVRVSAEIPGEGALAERSVELPADGEAITSLELAGTVLSP
ncbi:MAG: hypothetical protein GYA57_20530, partial [Myxococcales bacterium]|nr:hypothetical protein [Myxococcales bacterium]